MDGAEHKKELRRQELVSGQAEIWTAEKNEKRVTETAFGQWSSWNMDGAEHEARVALTEVGQ